MGITTGAKAGNGAAAVAFEQGSTWNTPVAVGANDGLRILSENITGGAGALERQTIGLPWGDKPDAGPEMWRGVITGDLFYNGNCGKFLSYVFGTSGSPTQTPPSTGTTYLHVCDVANSLAKFFTLVLARRAQVGGSTKWHEYKSAMMLRVRIFGSGNGRVSWEVEVIASALDRDSSTNTTTETDAVTVPTILGAVRFADGLFRINAQGGSALSSTTDDLGIAGFEFEIMRPLSADFLADGTGVLALPAEENVCDARLRVDLRSYDADTWIAAWPAGTEYKADLKFTGTGKAPTDGSDPYFQLQFPRLVVATQPQANLAGRGRVGHRVDFKCLVASSAPSGMSGVTQPVRLNVLDSTSGAYLS